MTTAKETKISEVNTYFTGPLATDPRKTSILAEIDGGTTPEMVLAVDVTGPATSAWREYQLQQISSEKDPYGRVMITYDAGGQKNLIMKTSAAKKIVNEADAAVLVNRRLKPRHCSSTHNHIQLQAAGGLVNVGDSVDVYLTTTNTSTTTTTNASNQTTTTTESTSTPKISEPLFWQF
jgi:hypothetical protein